MDRVNSSQARQLHSRDADADAQAEAAQSSKHSTKAGDPRAGTPTHDAATTHDAAPNPLSTPAKAGYATALSTLSDLSRRYPEAGVNPRALAQTFAGKQAKPELVRLQAAQRFVQAALANQPQLAGRLLTDLHLRHLPAPLQALVKQASHGASGAAGYAQGEALCRQLKSFSAEQIKDIQGMTAAGTPLAEAIAEERRELQRKPDFVPAPTLKRQVQQPLRQAAALRARADATGKVIHSHWQKTPDMSRAAEAQTAALALATLPSRVEGAAAALGSRLSTAELKGAVRQAQQVVELARGDITRLQVRTSAAHRQAIDTLSRFREAHTTYVAAMSSSPPDTLRAAPALQTMQLELKQLEPQSKQYLELNKQLRAQHAQFDDLLEHIVEETAIMAISAGLGKAALGGMGGHGMHSVVGGGVSETFHRAKQLHAALVGKASH